MTHDTKQERQAACLNQLRESLQNSEEFLKLSQQLRQPEQEQAGANSEDCFNNPAVDDSSLLRFLRARKWDVKAAETQFLKALDWRIRNRVDYILDEPDPNEPVYRAFCPHSNYSFDKEGRPVYIEKTGLIKLDRVLKYLKPEDLVTRHIRQQEIALSRMEESTQARHKAGMSPKEALVEKQTIIIDLKGLSLKPSGVGLKVFRECLYIDQEYYPERLGLLFFVNVPWIFGSIWRLIRPWLDPITREKFHVVRGNFQEVLQRYIDAESLPPEYGGTCTKEIYQCQREPVNYNGRVYPPPHLREAASDKERRAD